MPSAHLSWGPFRKYVTLGGVGGGGVERESHHDTKGWGGVSQVASRDGRLMLLDNLDEYILHIQAANFIILMCQNVFQNTTSIIVKDYINDYYSESGMKY